MNKSLLKPWLVKRSIALAVLCFAMAVVSEAQSRTGVVHFENSGAAAAQADFQEGLAQLHNFQYSQAEKLFQSAETKDPTFAMAYWGEALTHGDSDSLVRRSGRGQSQFSVNSANFHNSGVESAYYS